MKVHIGMVLAVLVALLFCAACTTEAPGGGDETTPGADCESDTDRGDLHHAERPG